MQFKKIPWVYEMPEIYSDGVFLTKRLDEISAESQKKLIFSVVTTLAQYFGGMHHYVDGLSLADTDYDQKCQLALGRILPIWLSGVCDVSVAQIVCGLSDILNLKTEYQKWPPKNVIEFYGVCKRPRPSYHDVSKEPSNTLQLEWDRNSARERTVKIAHECLIKIYRQLKGKDYFQVYEQKKKDGIYGKSMKEKSSKGQQFKKVEGE